MKKFLSILLAVTMLAGLLTLPTFADATTPRVLYEQDFENTTAAQLGYNVASTYYNAASNYSIDTWNGSKALIIDHQRSTWGCATLVPASTLTGVTKYTLEFTMQQDQSSGYPQDLFGIRVGKFNTETAVGDWIQFRGGNSIKITNYNDANSGSGLGNAMFTKFAKATIRIEVDATAGIIRVFRDGELKINATGACTAVDGIYWLAGQTKVYIDNIKVTEGISEITNDTSNDWPVRPDADYTGKQAGEIIFSENFDNANTVQEAFWQPVNTPYFSSGAIEASIATAVNNTNCVKVAGGSSMWGAFEIVPAKALETYDYYTIHMTLNAETFGQRFSIMYNSATMDNTQNCGLLELRWDETILRNQGFVNGTSNSYNDDPLTGVTEGTNFELAIQVDREHGITTTYVNGEYFNVGLNISTNKGAIYVVAQECVVSMDNLMVTAGTYEDYAGDSEDDITPPTGSTEDTTETEPTTADTTATTEIVTTDSNAKSGGCGSVASMGGIVLLMTLGAAYTVVDNKKRLNK